jgi:hypothetical protein
MRLFGLLIIVSVLFAAPLEAQISLPVGQSTAYDFDKSASFVNFRTYKWVNVPSTEQLDELTAGQLVGTLEVELAKKGLTRTNADSADLYIGYQVATSKKKPSASEVIGASYGSAGGGSASGTASVTTVHSGLLTLLVFDGANKKLIWRGEVSNSIDADGKPEQKQKRLSKTVEKLLSHYPPPRK